MFCGIASCAATFCDVYCSRNNMAGVFDGVKRLDRGGVPGGAKIVKKVTSREVDNVVGFFR